VIKKRHVRLLAALMIVCYLLTTSPLTSMARASGQSLGIRSSAVNGNQAGEIPKTTEQDNNHGPGEEPGDEPGDPDEQPGGEPGEEAPKHAPLRGLGPVVLRRRFSAALPLSVEAESGIVPLPY
jgi:hypothetical protein